MESDQNPTIVSEAAKGSAWDDRFDAGLGVQGLARNETIFSAHYQTPGYFGSPCCIYDPFHCDSILEDRFFLSRHDHNAPCYGIDPSLAHHVDRLVVRRI